MNSKFKDISIIIVCTIFVSFSINLSVFYCLKKYSSTVIEQQLPPKSGCWSAKRSSGLQLRECFLGSWSRAPPFVCWHPPLPEIIIKIMEGENFLLVYLLFSSISTLICSVCFLISSVFCCWVATSCSVHCTFTWAHDHRLFSKRPRDLSALKNDKKAHRHCHQHHNSLSSSLLLSSSKSFKKIVANFWTSCQSECPGKYIEPASKETVHPRTTPYFMDRIFVIPCSNHHRHIHHRKTVYTTHFIMIKKKERPACSF